MVESRSNGSRAAFVRRNPNYPLERVESNQNRIVITPDHGGLQAFTCLPFDPQSEALKVDESFRDMDGKPGLNFENCR